MGIVIRNNGQGGRVKFTSLGLGGGFNTTMSGITQQQGGGEGSSLLLDTYTNASAAFSLRKLRTNYNGSAIRVRRNSDNTEQDIGFLNDQLNTSSLQTFIGGTNLLTYSEDFSVWATNLSATINSNVTTDPLGGNTADRLNFGTSANSEVYLQPISWQTTTYNISIYAKSDSTNKFRVKIWNGSTATFSSEITTTSTWTRYDVSLSVNSGVGNFGISNIAAGGAGSIFIWGAQISVSTLQPYQVTAGSAITTNRDGFVTTWYDQSGNSKHITQTTAGTQPRIVSAGNVDTLNGKPTVWWLNNTYLNRVDPVTITNVVFTAKSENSPNQLATIYNKTGVFTGDSGLIRIDGSNAYYQAPTSAGHSALNITYDLGTFYFNNSLVTTSNLVTTAHIGFVNVGTNHTSADGIIIGSSYFGRTWKGPISEFILFGTNQGSNRSQIQSNINSYYSIY